VDTFAKDVPRDCDCQAPIVADRFGIGITTKTPNETRRGPANRLRSVHGGETRTTSARRSAATRAATSADPRPHPARSGSARGRARRAGEDDNLAHDAASAHRTGTVSLTYNRPSMAGVPQHRGRGSHRDRLPPGGHPLGQEPVGMSGSASSSRSRPGEPRLTRFTRIRTDNHGVTRSRHRQNARAYSGFSISGSIDISAPPSSQSIVTTSKRSGLRLPAICPTRGATRMTPSSVSSGNFLIIRHFGRFWAASRFCENSGLTPHKERGVTDLN